MKYLLYMEKRKKIAIVFDDLIQQGGAERLLCAVSEIFPTAPIYTSIASKNWLSYFSNRNVRVITSFMQKIPFCVKLNRILGLFGLHGLAFSNFVFDDYEIVLSISARFAHHIVTKPETIHVCYINSPGRMFWEPTAYFEGEQFFSRKALKILFNLFGFPLLSYLRIRDYVCAQRVDFFIANSRTPQMRVNKYYRRDADIIYPFHDMVSISTQKTSPSNDYYIIISRLQAWKKIDIAIRACERNKIKLKIIGEGPDLKRLKSYANEYTQFLGRVSDDYKKHILENCLALIMPQKEDFGIIALEAMALGKPVIAYGFGGALETVVDGVTGSFFYSQDEKSLADVLLNFESSEFKTEDCFNQAVKFSKSRFEKELNLLIESKLLEITDRL